MNYKKLFLVLLLLVGVVSNSKAKILSIDSKACAELLLENAIPCKGQDVPLTGVNSKVAGHVFSKSLIWIDNTINYPELFLIKTSKKDRHNASNGADIQLLFPNPITSLELTSERSGAGNLGFFIAGRCIGIDLDRLDVTALF